MIFVEEINAEFPGNSVVDGDICFIAAIAYKH